MKKANDLSSESILLSLKNELSHIKNQRIELDKAMASNEGMASAINNAIDMVHRMIERQKEQ